MGKDEGRALVCMDGSGNVQGIRELFPLHGRVRNVLFKGIRQLDGGLGPHGQRGVLKLYRTRCGRAGAFTGQPHDTNSGGVCLGPMMFLFDHWLWSMAAPYIGLVLLHWLRMYHLDLGRGLFVVFLDEDGRGGQAGSDNGQM